MACVKPLRGFVIGTRPSGKDWIYITNSSVDYVVPQFGDTCIQGVGVPPSGVNAVTDFMDIPCGNCIECRLAYSRRWADRCMLELKDHASSWFVTLTYDEAHVPLVHLPGSGAENVHMTLCMRDFQLFMKNLRQHYKRDLKRENKLRYFAAGEYGDLSERPHYHVIIFGLELPEGDLHYYKRDKARGYWLYKSTFLQSIWQYGQVIVGEVNWDTCAYTARYIMKKQKGATADIYSILGIEPPFVVMSRRPGIARRYYDEHPELFDYSSIFLSGKDGGKKVSIPKYFDSMLEVDNPELYAARKQQRLEYMKHAEKVRMSRTDLSKEEMLEVQSESKAKTVKSLRRKSL